MLHVVFFHLLLANSPGSERIHFQSLGKRSCMCVSAVPEGLAPELVQTNRTVIPPNYFGSGKGAKIKPIVFSQSFQDSGKIFYW